MPAMASPNAAKRNKNILLIHRQQSHHERIHIISLFFSLTACVEDWHRLLSCAQCFFYSSEFFCFFRLQTRHEAGREVFLFFHARFTIDFVSGVSFADWTVFAVGSLS